MIIKAEPIAATTRAPATKLEKKFAKEEKIATYFEFFSIFQVF